MSRAASTRRVAPGDLTDLRQATVGSLLDHAAQTWPSRFALRWPMPSGLAALTWHEVWSAANSAAALLRGCSNAQAPVGIWAPNSAEWYVWLWAAALAGRPLVPINPALTDSEVRTILADSAVSTVLAAPTYRERALLDAINAMKPDLSTLAETWDINRPLSESACEIAADRQIEPADTFIVQYTSGTTGTPKGAVLSHRACVNAARTMIPALEPTDHEILCSPLPLHHIGALIAHALMLAVIGGTYVMLTEFSAQEFIEAAAQSRATVLGGVPTVYLRVVEEPRLAEVRVPHVRVLMLGGASIPPSLVARLEHHFGASVSLMYGQSEAPAITQTRLDDSPSVKANTVGRALPHRELRIIDSSTGEPLPLGEIGEICVRTPVRMDGYLHRPDATSTTIDGDGWLHTGDLGSLDDDGLLRFHGRLRDMIIRGGENVYAKEVEDAIESHPDVARVAVVGLPDGGWGEIVAAAVVPRASACLALDELNTWVSQHLAAFKRPKVWHIVAELPTTASGKPQKFKIVEALEAIRASEAGRAQD